MCILLRNISGLATPAEELPPYEIRIIEDAIIAADQGKIAYIGPESGLPPLNIDAVYNCRGSFATPGLIDSHTHPVFSAAREHEFHMRNAGKSYAEIAASGGGIRASVRELRKASIEYLVELLRDRFNGFLALGTTTIEAKSGYGLSFMDEMKSLRALKELREHPLEVIPTFLGAHEIPDEYRGQRESYIQLLIDEMIPAVVSEGLAEYCDIFVEKNVYTVEEARRILTAAKNAGLALRLHVDQLTSGGGAELAAELGAVSAEHLDYISDEGIDRMIEAGVVFNLLPGAVFFLGHTKYPPARKIIDKGGIIALSTDFNPGSSMTRSLPLMMTIACVYMGMSADEALASVTLNAARSVKRNNIIGSLEAGKQADIVLWDIPGHDYIPYHYGENLVNCVFKKGRLVYRKPECGDNREFD
ncbi:imidazolonepropionase [bacterium]|nr:imidazolonepropionase [FCB group bacterium]MBL7191552.1 imidazolonepropionase [bacterium]